MTDLLAACIVHHDARCVKGEVSLTSERRHLRGEIHVRAWVPLAAIAADAVALVAFTIVKGTQDWLIVVIASEGSPSSSCSRRSTCASAALSTPVTRQMRLSRELPVGLAEADRAGQLHPRTDSGEAARMLTILISGLITADGQLARRRRRDRPVHLAHR
jgi:hypothetical protein